MGQPNEKEDPYILMDYMNSYQLDEKKDNTSEKTFNSLKSILDEYLNYKAEIDKVPKKKFGGLRKKTLFQKKNHMILGN